MKLSGARSSNVLIVSILILLLPAWTAAQTTFSHIVVFGASLSDTGNAFALTGLQSTPPYDRLDAFLVPDAPYAKGGHHLSNGATWIEQLARPLGLAGDVRPAFMGSGTNYAVGAARARNDGINFDLSLQVNTFLQDAGGIAPSDTLYTLEFGGNDVRDAVLSDDPEAILNAALAEISANILTLYQSGARQFLVWNVPDVGLSPAAGILEELYPGAREYAGFLSSSFNLGLGGILEDLAALPGIRIVLLDAYQVLYSLITDPQAFGLRITDEACIMPNQPPFECKKPDEYLFWDGVHPTKRVHGILAQAASSALALP